MAGNTIGSLFRVTTWGESHGPALGAVVDGCPPGLELGETDIQAELDRRRPGRLASASARREADRVEILSGVFAGKTTGTPIALLIRNRDADSSAYDAWSDRFRPGHGDFPYQQKYGIRDHRGGGRASARETVARVAAGAVARKILAGAGVAVRACTRELAGIVADTGTPDQAGKDPLGCPDLAAAKRMRRALEEARRAGDTVGGVVEILVTGCPAGLGDPVFDKLDAGIAGALMGIGTVKGVEIGAGFAAARMRGSQANDPLIPGGFGSNFAGGILAGIATGQDILIRVACKPIPSIAIPQDTITMAGEPVKIAVEGRHDACVIPRILPVCEAMVSLVLADHLLRQRALRGERPVTAP